MTALRPWSSVLREAARVAGRRPHRRKGRALGEHRHPRTVFEAALARGNLLVAETTAVELGWIDLLDALELAALLATKDPERAERAKGDGYAATSTPIPVPACARPQPFWVGWRRSAARGMHKRSRFCGRWRNERRLRGGRPAPLSRHS